MYNTNQLKALALSTEPIVTFRINGEKQLREFRPLNYIPFPIQCSEVMQEAASMAEQFITLRCLPLQICPNYFGPYGGIPENRRWRKAFNTVDYFYCEHPLVNISEVQKGES